MMQGVKLAALFMGYGLVGYSGDHAVGLLDQDVGDHFGSLGSCDYQVERRVAVSASAARLLQLRAGSGELTVEGREGLDRVEAVGRVCASDESYLDELQLTLDREGDNIVLSAHYPDRSRRSRSGGRDYARIDLAVELPGNMAVDIEDSSGAMDVRGTRALTIDDSSGEIRVADVSGPVTIDDSSGGITVRGVGGDVTIDDGSGEVEVSDVRGSVRLDDGSGSISVRDIDGDFQVRADGSGGIRYSGVAGSVDVPARKGRSRRGGD